MHVHGLKKKDEKCFSFSLESPSYETFIIIVFQVQGVDGSLHEMPQAPKLSDGTDTELCSAAWFVLCMLQLLSYQHKSAITLSHNLRAY